MGIRDLTGQKFNRLSVIERDFEKQNETRSRTGRDVIFWKCKCDCGNTSSVCGAKLKNGHTGSCGCYGLECRIASKFNDLTGQKFNRLLVIEKDIEKQKLCKYNLIYWKCLCDCGNNTSVYGSKLKSGHTKSCGCYNSENISKIKSLNLDGQRFGRLVVIDRNLEYQKTKNCEQSYWNCLCDCGNKSVVSGSQLNHKNTQSCGCYKLQRISETHTKHGKRRDVLSGKITYNEYEKFLDKDFPYRSIHRGISRRIKLSLKDGKKGKTFDHLPYTDKELTKYIESLFLEWMNWDNYGKEWHIDHIIPHCLFPYLNLEDPLMKECWMLDNLRPLHKNENYSKKDSIFEEHLYLLDKMPVMLAFHGGKEVLLNKINIIKGEVNG